MGYSAADEAFTHQLPRPFDEVHNPDPTWSDRCYFFAASPDGKTLLASGYGNNPNTNSGLGYVKVSLADGRHWDLMAGRPVGVDDRADLSAGPMRWTCVEPLKKWRLDIEPNDSGIEWELYYEPTAPMWELLPMKVSDKQRRHARRHVPHERARTLVRLGADRWGADLGRRMAWRPGPHLRCAGFGQDRLLAVARRRLRRPCDRGVGDRILGWNSQLRRRRHHPQRRHAVEAVRQHRPRCRVRW